MIRNQIIWSIFVFFKSFCVVTTTDNIICECELYEVPTYVYTYSRLSEEGSRSHPLVASAIPVEEVESDRVVRTGL